MNQLLDLAPVLIFVVVFFTTDIYYATGALMAAVTVQVVAYLLMKKPVSRELQLTFWASLIFGGLTLAFQNETFIQWKPTIVNWLLAGSLIGSHFIGGKNLIEHLLSKQLTLIDEVLTPDSSRFWPVEEYQPGTSPVSFDKQFVRDYLETLDWNKTAPGPELPEEIVTKTAEKYHQARQLLTQ